MTDAFRLDGRTALVTGASRGIGAALSVALGQAGATLVLTGRDEGALAATAKAVRASGTDARTLVLDVASPDSIAAAFAALRDTRLDILVNNAGVEEVRASEAVDEALWDRIVGTNLKGAFFCAQAFARNGAGDTPRAILNLCSLTSAVGIPTAVPYGSAKTGLVGMTRALAAEWAGRGIRVNGLGPGYFRTAMTDSFFDDDGWANATRNRIPLGRFGELEDLTGPAVFLCSDAARYVTGQVLYADGGMLASL